MLTHKRKTKLLGLLLCVVLKAQLAVSQENYVPGYIIGNDGDTLRGFIDYGKWDINPDRIRFKATTAEDGVFYNPIDIAGFGVPVNCMSAELWTLRYLRGQRGI